MKLVKSLLLGSAAGLCAVAGAQAADLPVRKAAPVEYVRVCTAYGAGFFYIPGTDTCLRVGGRARFEYTYINQRSRNSSDSGYRGLGRLNLDARTQTAYGTLRAFVRFEIASRTGGYLKSGTQERYANAFTGTGIDTVATAQQFVNVDKAFVQFAGFTAGRAASFFDFYAGDLELIGSSVGSNVSSTNVLAYTATIGNGFSATIAAEDPTFRRNPIFYNVAAGTTGLAAGVAPAAQNGVNFQTGAIGLAFVGNAFNAAGVPTSAVALDVAQRNNVPDVVGVVRYDAPWGSAQVSAASHELRTGGYNLAAGSFAANGGPAVAIGAPGSIVPRVPNSEYGYAVQGGAKFNLPQLGTGDVLWLQAAYAKGADSYSGIVVNGGSETITNSNTNRSVFGAFDAFTDAQGRLHLTESYSGTVSYLHYYSPEWRQAIFGSYGRAHFDQALRNPTQSFVGNFSPANVGAVTFGGGIFSPTGKDYSHIYVGSNLIWSPVRDLDIGVEAVYDRLEFLGGASKGRVVDLNKTPTAAFALRTISVDDSVQVRVRVQRDF